MKLAIGGCGDGNGRDTSVTSLGHLMTWKDKIVCHAVHNIKVHAAQRAATRPSRNGLCTLSEQLRAPFQDTFDRIRQLLVPFDAFVRATPRRSQRRDRRFLPSVSNGLQRAIQFPTRATIHPSVSLHSRSRIVSVGIVLVKRDSLNCACSL